MNLHGISTLIYDHLNFKKGEIIDENISCHELPMCLYVASCTLSETNNVMKYMPGMLLS